MRKRSHTATPWVLQSHTGGTEYDFLIVPGDRSRRKFRIADVVGRDAEAQANAEFILLACNNHDALKSLLKRLQIQVSHACLLHDGGTEIGPFIWADLVETCQLARMLLAQVSEKRKRRLCPS